MFRPAHDAGPLTQAYGRFEARIKIPRGQGMWPAFWMLGDDIGSAGWPNSGEIDIMENIGSEPNTVHGTMHGPGYSGGERHRRQPHHRRAVRRRLPHLRGRLGAQRASLVRRRHPVLDRVTPADLGGNPWVFDHPFFMILNVAVGGYWPGSPDQATRFPQTSSSTRCTSTHDSEVGVEIGKDIFLTDAREPYLTVTLTSRDLLAHRLLSGLTQEERERLNQLLLDHAGAIRALLTASLANQHPDATTTAFGCGT